MFKILSVKDKIKKESHNFLITTSNSGTKSLNKNFSVSRKMCFSKFFHIFSGHKLLLSYIALFTCLPYIFSRGHEIIALGFILTFCHDLFTLFCL